jgi:hypothetical protein
MNGMSNESLRFFRLEKPALVVGLVGLAATAFLAMQAQEQFFRSWLVAFIFWMSLTIGALAIAMLQYMTGGWWGYIIRKPLLAGAANLPLMLVAALPIYLGADRLYKWTDHALMEADHILHKKIAYLNVEAFWIRGAVFFAIWMIWAFALRRADRRYDETGTPQAALTLRRWSASGLLIVAITVTFASVDWMMSLDPYWFSTMFGISYIVGAVLLAFAFMNAFVTSAADQEPISEAADPLHFRDLGNLMFAFIMLWAYTAFAQYLLIWYSNIKEEIPWYIIRSHGAWGAISVILIVCHFFLPFLLLLMRGIKDRAKLLGKIAIFIIVMRAVDYYWIIAPNFTTEGHHAGFHLHPLDFTTILGLGGVWVFLFLRNLKKGPVLPAHESLEGAKEGAIHG